MGHRLSSGLKSCLQGSRGQERETLPGARKRSHKINKALNAGEPVGAGSWHIMSPPGVYTARVYVYVTEDLHIWTPSALSLATTGVTGTLQTPQYFVSILYTNSLL